MKKATFTLTLLFILGLIPEIQAQKSLNMRDVSLENADGDKFYGCMRDENKTPLNGKLRVLIKDNEYVDAQFKNGYATGKWEYFVEEYPSRIVNYKDGYKDGEYTKFYYKGVLSQKGVYVKDKKEGVWEEYRESSLKYKEIYKNNKLLRKDHYSSEGVLTYTKEYMEGDVLKVTSYYKDGKIEDEKHYKGEKLNGLVRQYTVEGKLKAQKNYINNKQVGNQLQYVFSNTGNYIIKSNYNEQGQLDGEYIEVFEGNNAVKTKGKYVNGKKSGRWIYGYKHKLYKEEIYKDDMLIDTKVLGEYE